MKPQPIFIKYITVLFLILIASYSNFCYPKKGAQFIRHEHDLDTSYTYFNSNGEIIDSKIGSYSYQQIIPYGSDSLDLYNIVHYYTETDSLKSNGYIYNFNHPFEFGVKYTGEFVSYFPNGNLESLQRFDEYSEPIDSSYYYYPNGKLKMIVVHQEIGKKIFSGTTDTHPFYLLYLDSVGNYLVKRGNGFLRISGPGDSYIEGELKNNKKEGKWSGWNMGTFYEELYHDDLLFQGKRFKKNGDIVLYFQENMESIATYPKGLQVFMRGLYENLNISYDLIKGISSESISVTFMVDRDGRTRNFRIAEQVPLKFREQLVSAIQKMGNWIPAKLQGMEVNVNYTIPIRIK